MDGSCDCLTCHFRRFIAEEENRRGELFTCSQIAVTGAEIIGVALAQIADGPAREQLHRFTSERVSEVIAVCDERAGQGRMQ